MSRLRCASSNTWLQAVLNDFDTFLLDHAACERKASATALALVKRYPDRPSIVSEMIDLAVEELQHFQQVYQHVEAKGLRLTSDLKDPYVGLLRQQLRHGDRDTHLLDELLIASVVEARGCERFGLIADALPEGPLKDFYMDITRSEARHSGTFVRLAKQELPVDTVMQRLDELLQIEAHIVEALPIRAALH